MGMLMWVTPDWEYTVEVGKRMGGKNKKVKTTERTFKVQQQAFMYHQSAVDHARKHQIPLRLIKQQISK
jgi:hypothetical protein